MVFTSNPVIVAVVSAVFWEHDVFDPVGKFERNLVGLGGVAVERVGGVNGGPDVPGDESKAFEAMGASKPVVAAVAGEEPQMALKPVAPRTVAMARPPGIWPTNLWAESKSLLAIPELNAT